MNEKLCYTADDIIFLPDVYQKKIRDYQMPWSGLFRGQQPWPKGGEGEEKNTNFSSQS